jgi:hypothetical protein
VKLLVNRRVDPDSAFVHVHVPKCAGTYAKNLVDENLTQLESSVQDCHLDMHQSLDSICGHRVSYRLYAANTFWTGEYGSDRQMRTMIGCPLRDPRSWYDSQFYYKQGYSDRSDRHKYESPPRMPLSAPSDDYRFELQQSLDDDFIKNCSHTVIQGGFCPSVWMQELDIGLYSAWLLYMISDHKYVFDNLKKFRGDGLLQNYNLIAPWFDSVNFYDTSVVHEAVTNQLSAFHGQKINLKRQGKARKTEYKEGYLKCSDVLREDDRLANQFRWKERIFSNMVR